jgi:hypothetical protein
VEISDGHARSAPGKEVDQIAEVQTQSVETIKAECEFDIFLTSLNNKIEMHITFNAAKYRKLIMELPKTLKNKP